MNDASTPPRNSNLFSVLKYAGIATGIIGGTFFLFRIMDAIFFWSFYSSIFEKIQKLGGFEDSITGMITILVTAILMLVFPVAIGAFLTGNRKKLLLVAGVAALWFLGTFILSRPREGEYFNKVTGAPQYKYCTASDGQASLHNIGYNFDPKTGQKLELFTSEVAKKHPEIFNLRPLEVTNSTLTPTLKPQITTPKNDATADSKRNVTRDGVLIARIAREPEIPSTPKPKSRAEVAKDAPVCIGSKSITLRYGDNPRADIKLNQECWSAWLMFDFQDYILNGRLIANIRNDEDDLIFLFSDGRIFDRDIPNIVPKPATQRIDGSYDRFRLMGSGTARAAIGRGSEELEEMLNTPIRANSPTN